MGTVTGPTARGQPPEPPPSASRRGSSPRRALPCDWRLQPAVPSPVPPLEGAVAPVGWPQALSAWPSVEALGIGPPKPSDSWKTSLEMETPPRDHVRGVVGGLSTAADRASSSCSQGHPSEPRPAVRAVPEPPTREEGRPAPRETQLRAVATTQVLLSIVRDVPHAVPCRRPALPGHLPCGVFQPRACGAVTVHV